MTDETRLPQQRWLKGEVEPSTVCGYPSWNSMPRPSGSMERPPDSGWSFCTAPPTPHGDHPLANCFRKATPCQVLRFAPFERESTTCQADTVEYFLENLGPMLTYYRELLVDPEPAKPSRSSLDFWTRTNEVGA